jgi:dihydroorotate dehydrogenase|tara:strand:- start:56535 stop:57236 length:702 start_codon:yes stop_codon:yes gene_type:complete
MTYYIAAPFGNYLKTKKTRSVVGSFTLERRTGLLKQIASTLRYRNGIWYNALGLRNPGIEFGLKYYYRSKNDVLSLAAVEPKDWIELSKIVPPDIDLEINISCPNIEHFDDYTQGVENFINGKRKVIAKLAPGTEIATVGALIDLGFTSFHCCNTLPTEHGGMSGRKLRPYVVNLCTVIKSLAPDAEIIAGGGIYDTHDVIHYKNFGATSYSLGTVCFHPIKFYKLIKDIREL